VLAGVDHHDFPRDGPRAGTGQEDRRVGDLWLPRAVFELVRMHRVFDICATREDAVRAFGSKAP